MSPTRQKDVAIGRYCLASQLEPSFACSDGVLAAGRSIRSLKYKHHFGLDCFSMRREHWALHASLAHSINDVSFAASGLDASALAVRALCRTGFGGGKICSAGATSSTSRSKIPLSVHPPRASSANRTKKTTYSGSSAKRTHFSKRAG
jgi:hypothetical protein